MTTNNLPLVSVIIPTFNRAGQIANAIRSVQSQTYRNIELIIVDDGSTDNTSSVVQSFDNLKYIYKTNGRQASARNAGAREARGTFIATLDSDDCWKENFVSESVEIMSRYELDMVFTNHDYDNRQNVLNGWQVLHPYFHGEKNRNEDWIIMDRYEARKIFTLSCPAPSSGLLIRRSCIEAGWDERLHVADDWDFVLSLLVRGIGKIGFGKKSYWVKHIVGDNIYESLSARDKLEKVISKDLDYIIRKNAHYLTREEKSNFKKLKVLSYLDEARKLLACREIRPSVFLLGKSLQTSVRITARALSHRDYKGFVARNLRTLKRRLRPIIENKLTHHRF